MDGNSNVSEVDDQKLIADYFSSSAYQRTKSKKDAEHDPQWILTHSLTLEPETVATRSFCFGLFGINTIFLVFGFVIPILAEVLEAILDPGPGGIQLLAIPAFVVPLVICFAMATVAPMFWYGAIWFRFAVAGLMILPGCCSLYGAMTLLEPNRSRVAWSFAVGLAALYLAVAAVTLGVQMWSTWTLTHRRLPEISIPPIGTRSIMELTGIAALICAACFSFEIGDMAEVLLFSCSMGLFSALTVVAYLIAFLRHGHRNYAAGSLALSLSYVTSFVATGFFEATSLGWQVDNHDFRLVAIVSGMGVLTCGAVVWLSLWWLRSCGWVCVSRAESNGERKSPFALKA